MGLRALWDSRPRREAGGRRRKRMTQILFYAAYGVTLVGAAALTWWSFAG